MEWSSATVSGLEHLSFAALLKCIFGMFLPLFSHIVLVSSCVERAMQKSNIPPAPPSTKIFYKYLMEEAATQWFAIFWKFKSISLREQSITPVSSLTHIHSWAYSIDTIEKKIFCAHKTYQKNYKYNLFISISAYSDDKWQLIKLTTDSLWYENKMILFLILCFIACDESVAIW